MKKQEVRLWCDNGLKKQDFELVARPFALLRHDVRVVVKSEIHARVSGLPLTTLGLTPLIRLNVT